MMRYNKTKRNKQVTKMLNEYGIKIEEISQEELNQRIKDKIEGYYIRNKVSIIISKSDPFEQSDDELF